MSFIKSYGISLPKYRIDDNVLDPKKRNNLSQAVCFTDEDIISLAYQASNECICDNEIDAVFFATTSPVFKNRYHAAFISELLGLNKSIFSLDFIGTERSGTDALLIAHELINSNKFKNILIIAVEVHFASIGKELLSAHGHGACSLLISNKTGLAEISNCFNVGSQISEEFIYKNNYITLDTRYSRDEGYKKNMLEVIKIIEPHKTDLDKIILNSKYSKSAGTLFLKSGFRENQLSIDNVYAKIGNTGTAGAFFQLIYEIEKLSNNILLVDYANGSNVFLIKTTITTSKNILKDKIDNCENINSYQDYLKLRKEGHFNSVKYNPRDIFSSEMMNEREKKAFINLKGLKCNNCQTVYLIKTERCKKCKSEEFCEVKLSEKGKIYSFTPEHYFPVSFPPVTMLVIDLDGGGRITVQQTDCMYPKHNNVKIGNEAILVLRKMTERDLKPNYFLKAIVKQ